MPITITNDIFVNPARVNPGRREKINLKALKAFIKPSEAP